MNKLLGWVKGKFLSKVKLFTVAFPVARQKGMRRQLFLTWQQITHAHLMMTSFSKNTAILLS